MFLKRILTYSVLSLATVCTFFANVSVDIDHPGSILASVSLDGGGVYAAGGTCKEGEIAVKKDGKEIGCEADTSWNSAIRGINMAFLIISTIISPVILFAGWLMSPDWTSGDIFGLREPMYALWVTVSNIVYFIYAILLVLIALGTMFGHNIFSYRTMLPRLALGILMVPFTWWFVQWTISIASVVTASVLTIPHETIKDSEWFTTKPSIPRKIVMTGEDTSMQQAIKSCQNESVANENCTTPREFLSGVGGMYGPLVVYAYSVFNVHELKTLPTGIDVATAAISIVHQSFIGVLMFLIFGLLILALTSILLVRAIKLWVYAIFSPLFTFQFVAGKELMGSYDTFTIKEFIGLAFVPAVIGLTLSFGLIIISAISSTSTTEKGEKCDLTSEKGCSITIMGDASNSITRKWTKESSEEGKPEEKSNYKTTTTFQWGKISFVFNGRATNQSFDDTQSGAIGALDAIGGTFGTIIIDIIALVFIWMAFMAAKLMNKVVDKAIKPFEEIGNKVGNMAMSLPKYTPLPIPGGSLSGASKIMANAENAMIARSDDRFKNSAGGKLFGGDKVVATVDENKLASALKDAGKNSLHPGWKIAGDIIEKQSGKDVEYSSVFKDLAGALKGMDLNNQKNALKTAGYSNDNANTIIDRLNKFNNGEFNKNDVILTTALKSRIGSSSSTSGGVNSGTGGGSSINLNIDTNDTNDSIISSIKESYKDNPPTKANIESTLKEKFKDSNGKISDENVQKINEIIKNLDNFLKQS